MLRMEHAVSINGNQALFDTLLLENDELIINISTIEERDFLPDDQSIDVVYEDRDYLIVNKPSGLIIHPDDKQLNNTLVNRISRYYLDNNINRQIRYCHRLDRDTTGALMIAKHYFIHAYMANHWDHDHVKRSYLALVFGRFKTESGVWSYPIGRDRHEQNKYRVNSSGDLAITHYQVIKNYDDYALLRLTLETGKTHQIRVHCSHTGHPLLGDKTYGGPMNLIARTALHSEQIEWINPLTQQKHTIIVPIPDDMKKLI